MLQGFSRVLHDKVFFKIRGCIPVERYEKIKEWVGGGWGGGPSRRPDRVGLLLRLHGERWSNLLTLYFNTKKNKKKSFWSAKYTGKKAFPRKTSSTLEPHARDKQGCYFSVIMQTSFQLSRSLKLLNICAVYILKYTKYSCVGYNFRTFNVPNLHHSVR